MEYINVFASGKAVYDNRTSLSGTGTTLALPNSQPKMPLAQIIIILVAFVLQIILSIWNISAIIKYFRVMPIAAGILSILLALFGFPFFSLVTIYASKNMYTN